MSARDPEAPKNTRVLVQCKEKHIGRVKINRYTLYVKEQIRQKVQEFQTTKMQEFADRKANRKETWCFVLNIASADGKQIPTKL